LDGVPLTLLCSSGLAILSALITFFFIVPLDHDGMAKEDAIVRDPSQHLSRILTYMHSLKFRQYLEDNGFDTSGMGFADGVATPTDSIPEDLPEKEKATV
jgi:hypothetical protein